MSDSEVLKGVKRLAGAWDTRYMPLIWVFCLLVVFDIFDRFVPQNVTGSRLAVSVDMPLGDMPRLNDQAYQAYLEKLAAHVTPVTVDAPEPVDNINVSAQNDVWQAGAFSYKLLAVFQSMDQFAVLQRVEVASGERQIIDARLGDVIDKHTVTEIALHRMAITSVAGERVELVLFERPQDVVLGVDINVDDDLIN
ncbi:MAG: hypothetical protein OSB34_08900 [Planktomarina sp.]|nr:hypothetical protein [Planktomarina sp.]